MKNLFYLFITISILTSCSTSYELRSISESFDALTQITFGDYPSIMPNGGDYNKNLVFVAQDEAGIFNIYMKDNVLTRARIQKTFGDGMNLSPSYNEATKRIAFQRFDGSDFDISYIDAYEGKAVTSVTNNNNQEYNPNWSPDGQSIVFERGAPPILYLKPTGRKGMNYVSVAVTKNQIWIKDLKTGEMKMIGEGSFPAFSPNGVYVAFVKYELDKKRNTEIGTIWIMNREGERQMQITNSSLGYATNPCWSPDGGSLIFQLAKKNENPDIYTIKINGENLKQHTSNESRDFFPYWSKDGYVYFSSDRNGKEYQFHIWRFKIAE